MTDSIVQVRVRVLPDGRLAASDAAGYVGSKEKTLANWRSQGKGPKFIRVGGRIFYFQNDLDSFIRAKATVTEETPFDRSTTKLGGARERRHA